MSPSYGVPDRFAKRPAPVNPPPVSVAPQVALAHGKWRLSMSPVAALVLLACVACVAVGYLLRQPPGDPTRMLEAFRAEMATRKQEQVDAQTQLNHRLDVIETNLSDVKVDVGTTRGSVGALNTRIDDLRAELGRAEFKAAQR